MSNDKKKDKNVVMVAFSLLAGVLADMARFPKSDDKKRVSKDDGGKKRS